jgi:hypothetical protein
METVRDNVAALAYRDSVISSLTLACNTAGKDLDTAKMDKNKWRSRALWTWTGIAFILLAGTAYRLLRSQYAKKANAVKDLLS